MLNKDLIVEANTRNGYIAYYKNDTAFAWNLTREEPVENPIFETALVMEYVQDIVKASKVIVDGGAHAGSHTVLYKSINPGVTIHSFEPQSKMFDLLSHNVQKNNFNNVFVYNLALANKKTSITMGTSVSDVYYDENNEYMKLDNGEIYQRVYTDISYGDENEFNLGGLGFGKDGEEVQTTTIDSLGLNQCDFIKLDIEGAEILALHGSIETIKKYSPAIMFEYNHHQLDDEHFEFFDIKRETPFEFLEKLGYTVTPIGSDNYLAKIV